MLKIQTAGLICVLTLSFTAHAADKMGGMQMPPGCRLAFSGTVIKATVKADRNVELSCTITLKLADPEKLEWPGADGKSKTYQKGDTFTAEINDSPIVLRDGKRAKYGDIHDSDSVEYYPTRSEAPKAQSVLIAMSPEFNKLAAKQK